MSRAHLSLIGDSVSSRLPLRLGGLFICNQPWIFAPIFAVLRVVLASKILGRMHLLGARHEQLRSRISEASIPQALGGTLQLRNVPGRHHAPASDEPCAEEDARQVIELEGSPYDFLLWLESIQP
eukprot:SAG11_NODE_794_length_7137_cov_45.288576_3_plen_125_part_00